MSRDIADTANPCEPSSLGYSHFLVALGQVNRRLSDELSLFGDDPDVVAGDVETYSGASPGSTHAEMEHLVPEAEADLAGRVDLVVADAEVRVHPLHAGRCPFPRGEGGSRGGPVGAENVIRCREQDFRELRVTHETGPWLSRFSTSPSPG